MRINTRSESPEVFTHEGAPASRGLSALEQLRRTVSACMLWETGFYENGQTIAERIKTLVAQCKPEDVAALAIEAREKMRLRHAPLLLMRELARSPRGFAVSEPLARVIQRADELSEFLSIYWADGRRPLAKQVKKGLAAAFLKFNEYQLAKYNRDDKVKLRDVLFLVHAKPDSEERAAMWKRLVDGQLVTPDTWEVALSAGTDKRETFERLIREKKLGYLALLRNLRNMQDAGVDEALVFGALVEGAARSKALPFRFVAAARAVPQWEPVLDTAMRSAVAAMDRLPGETWVLVDVSGSMSVPLSSRSDLKRCDAAAALAVLALSIGERVRVFTFSNKLVEVPPRVGMGLIDAINKSQEHGGTELFGAVAVLSELMKGRTAPPDRLIIITDEQAHDASTKQAPAVHNYIINVGTSERGVGYERGWRHVSGFSEQVLNWIAAEEGVETTAAAEAAADD